MRNTFTHKIPDIVKLARRGYSQSRIAKQLGMNRITVHRMFRQVDEIREAAKMAEINWHRARITALEEA